MEWLDPLLEILKEIGLSGFLDMAIITLLLYSVLVWLKRTRRVAFVLTGILIIAGLYLVARQFNLVLTAGLFQGFFAIILVALVVIFQEELRYFFEQVTVWSMNRRLPGTKTIHSRLPRREVEILVKTLDDLARNAIGALVVLRGKDLIVRHLDGGEEVKGMLGEALLKSIFDPHSMGHDGAVVIDGNRIDRLGCHLPLSTNPDQLQGKGTRHSAALGLSELTDALCLVVSEERGIISAARRGELSEISNAAQLNEMVEAFYEEISPKETGGTWRGLWRRNSREKWTALALALGLWFVLVRESNLVQKSWEIPVEYSQLPSQLAVAEIRPKTVHVTLSGPRRRFLLVSRKEIRVVLKLWDAEMGQQNVILNSRDLSFPEGLQLEDVLPRSITLQLVETPAPGR